MKLYKICSTCEFGSYRENMDVSECEYCGE